MSSTPQETLIVFSIQTVVFLFVYRHMHCGLMIILPVLGTRGFPTISSQIVSHSYTFDHVVPSPLCVSLPTSACSQVLESGWRFAAQEGSCHYLVACAWLVPCGRSLQVCPLFLAPLLTVIMDPITIVATSAATDCF